MSGVDPGQTGDPGAPPPADPETLVYPGQRNGTVILVEAHEGETWIADMDGSITVPEDEWR